MATREEQPSGADSSVGQLVERLSAQVSALVRDEMALATAEMKRKGAQAGVGIGIGSAGAVVALLGLGALIAVAGVLAAAGIGQVRYSAPPVPEQAVQSTKGDIETVKESVHR